MATVKKSMRWTGGMKFEGTTKYGLKLVTDAAKSVGGDEDGYSPSELLLYGMIGCTGIDVLSILKKMRQNVTAIEIEAEAQQPDEHPKPYTAITLHYRIVGEGLDPERVKHAIDLSQNKYCVVSKTISQSTPTDYTVDIQEASASPVK